MVDTTPEIFTNKEDDGTYTGLSKCRCGPNNGPWRTSGWPKQSVAADRIRQHRREHETGEPMELLSEFRTRHGLVSAGNQAVIPETARRVKADDEGDE